MYIVCKFLCKYLGKPIFFYNLNQINNIEHTYIYIHLDNIKGHYIIFYMYNKITTKDYICVSFYKMDFTCVPHKTYYCFCGTFVYYDLLTMIKTRLTAHITIVIYNKTSKYWICKSNTEPNFFFVKDFKFLNRVCTSCQVTCMNLLFLGTRSICMTI